MYRSIRLRSCKLSQSVFGPVDRILGILFREIPCVVIISALPLLLQLQEGCCEATKVRIADNSVGHPREVAAAAGLDDSEEDLTSRRVADKTSDSDIQRTGIMSPDLYAQSAEDRVICR